MAVSENPFADPAAPIDQQRGEHPFTMGATLNVGKNATLTLGKDALLVLGEPINAMLAMKHRV